MTERDLAPLFDAAVRAGVELGAREVDGARASGTLRGALHGVQVALAVRFRRGQPDGYTLAARSREPSPGRVVVRPALVWPTLAFGWRVTSGDRPFDRRVSCSGPEVVVRALLTGAVRRTLASIAADGRFETIVFADARVAWRSVPGLEPAADALARILEGLAALAGAHGLGEGDVFDRLALVATTDEAPLAAFQAGRVLLELAEESEDPRVSRALRALVLGREVEVRQRAAAFAELQRRSAKQAVLVAEALVREAGPLAGAAVEYLGAVGALPSAGALLGLARLGDEALGAAIAGQLAKVGTSAAEAALIELLAHAKVDVRCAAARALGDVGSAAAVRPLAAAAKGWRTERRLVRAVDAAVRAIRARHGGGEPGTLSMPEDVADAGAVSVVEEAGQVSLSKKKPR